MYTYIITYDLNSPGKDYTLLLRTIEGLGQWRKPLKSAYFVKTSLTTLQIMQKLHGKYDENDYIYVCPQVKNAGGQLPKSFWDWFNQP